MTHPTLLAIILGSAADLAPAGSPAWGDPPVTHLEGTGQGGAYRVRIGTGWEVPVWE